MANIGLIMNNLELIGYILNQFFIKTLTFISLTIFAFSAFSAPAENDLPPILNYYPNCLYQIVEKTVESKFTDDKDSKDVVAELLKKLKIKAKKIDADSIILTEKKIVDLSKSTNNAYDDTPYKYQVSFSAELIIKCKDMKKNDLSKYDVKEKIIAAYNHQGIKSKSVLKFGDKSSTVNFSWSSGPKSTAPVITNNEVSLENGVYGIKLGMSYQQVTEAFGEPNIKLTILEDELIIGYGRRHWFHFQQDKLVKIQNTLSVLSADILNKIPLLDFFDERNWKIDNKMSWKSPLKDVKKTLKIDSVLNNKNQMVLNHLDNTLTLHFIRSKDHYTNENTYTLDRFSLEKSNYKQHAILPFNHQDIQNTAIEQTYLTLQQNEDVNLKDLVTKLGDPVGQIILPKNTTLNIYNPHLLIRIKYSELVKIHLIEEVFNRNNTMEFDDKPWTLGNYKQGKSLEQLKVHFPEDTFEDDEEIEIESSNYTLLLFFGEENQQNSLYEAEIKLY